MKRIILTALALVIFQVDLFARNRTSKFKPCGLYPDPVWTVREEDEELFKQSARKLSGDSLDSRGSGELSSGGASSTTATPSPVEVRGSRLSPFNLKRATRYFCKACDSGNRMLNEYEFCLHNKVHNINIPLQEFLIELFSRRFISTVLSRSVVLGIYTEEFVKELAIRSSELGDLELEREFKFQLDWSCAFLKKLLTYFKGSDKDLDVIEIIILNWMNRYLTHRGVLWSLDNRAVLVELKDFFPIQFANANKDLSKQGLRVK